MPGTPMRRSFRTTWLILISALVLSASSANVRAVDPPPLHDRIDRAISEVLTGPPAALSTDGEFLRRVHLDLTGIIPTADEARAFLDDPSPYKRARLIDELLERPRFARHMQEVFSVMLLERRQGGPVPDDAWSEYLFRAFLENRPFDRLASEILDAGGADPATRPAAKFLLARDAEPNQLTRDIGRIFLGRDLQCAQCHDHPLVEDYKQAHYFGLYAFLSRTSMITDAPSPGTVVEKAEGDVTFSSVFKKGITHQTGPRILDEPPVEEPGFAPGAAYIVPPNDKDRSVIPIPRFSRRARLAPSLTSGTVEEFDLNVANRLWALMMGRGLVHPLDMHGSAYPASHPELLEDLATTFRASGCDVKAFLREIALSQAYQRSSEPAPNMDEAELAPEFFAVAALRPMTPEQMGWSVMQGLGILDAYRQSAEIALGAGDPRMAAILELDTKRQELREMLVEHRVNDQLKSSLTPFIQQYGAAAGQPQDDSDATVHQALFVTNGEPIKSWLQPSGDRLTAVLAAKADPSEIAEDLYLGLLSRRPTVEECVEVERYLDSRGADARPLAIQELAWALLASIEFRFNH